MNAYESTQELAATGVAAVIAYLKNCPSISEITETVDVDEQTYHGDVRLRMVEILDKVYLEIKTEQTNPKGNLFLEHWSNKSTGRKGWIYNCEFDWLYYLFKDTKEAYLIDGKKFREFLKTEEFAKLEERKQRRRNQPNDSWGKLCPIKRLIELGIAHEVHHIWK
jgi:hypothetical protein